MSENNPDLVSAAGGGHIPTRAWLAAEKEAFHAAMNGAPLATSLGMLVDAVVDQTQDGRRCAFYIADETGGALSRVVGMPDSFARAVEGFIIACDSFSCGLAVAKREPVITADVLAEPKWAQWTRFAQEHDFRGSWSFPVETAAGKLVGSLAFYFSEPRDAQPGDHELAAAVTRSAAIIVAHYQEAEERKRAEAAMRASEARLQTLVAELQHRVRNILAVTRSVFRRTADASDDVEDLTSHFTGRLDALARTQVITTRSVRGTVDLEAMIRDELLSVGASDGPRVRIEGPEVSLSSKVAETLGLALHELTTNALKYGALGSPDGQVEIHWKSNTDYRGAPQLILIWQEQGVPTIPVEPVRQGFGRELIEEALPYRLGAETKLEFVGGGVRCSISLPLPD